MKKIISIWIVALIAISFASCEKSNEFAKEDNNISSVVTKAAPSWGLNKTWKPRSGKCEAPASDCFDDIDIEHERTFREKLLKFILDLHDNGFLSFANRPPEIDNYVDEVYVKAALNKELNVSAYENKEINTVFLIFSDVKTEKTVVVYPFMLGKE